MSHITSRIISRNYNFLARQQQVYINRRMKIFGLSSAEGRALLAVLRYEGCSQEFIVKFTQVNKSAIAKIIKLLEEKNMITKQKDEKDKRNYKLYSTAKAKSIEMDIMKISDDWMKFICRDLNDDEIEVVIKALNNMSDNAELLNSIG